MQELPFFAPEKAPLAQGKSAERQVQKFSCVSCGYPSVLLFALVP